MRRISIRAKTFASSVAFSTAHCLHMVVLALLTSLLKALCWRLHLNSLSLPLSTNKTLCCLFRLRTDIAVWRIWIGLAHSWVCLFSRGRLALLPGQGAGSKPLGGWCSRELWLEQRVGAALPVRAFLVAGETSLLLVRAVSGMWEAARRKTGMWLGGFFVCLSCGCLTDFP